MDDSGERRQRWRVTWKRSGPDPLVWLVAVAGVVFIVLCVIDGWTAGAALAGVGLGFLWTLHAFLTGHFLLEPPRHVCTWSWSSGWCGSLRDVPPDSAVCAGCGRSYGSAKRENRLSHSGGLDQPPVDPQSPR